MGLLDFEDSYTPPDKRKLEAKANRSLRKRKIRRSKRKKHKRKIPTMTYRGYMKSAYWKKRKRDYFGKYGKKCAVCEKKYGVTLHHKKYTAKFGEELDEDLIPLCPKHHHEFHQHHPLSKNMSSLTDSYVETARQMLNSNIDDLSWIYDR